VACGAVALPVRFVTIGMNEIKEKLSAEERKRLTQCNKVIAEAFTSCWGAGQALLEVRDSKLYREDFKTFEEYVQLTFQIERAHAYRLMSAFEIKQGIEKRSPAMAKLLTSESQARELAGVPMEKRVNLLRDVAKGGGPVTASAIRAKADTSEEQVSDSIEEKVSPRGDKTGFSSRGTMTAGPAEKEAEKKVPKDELGRVIPEAVLPLWNRQQEIQDLMTLASKLRTALKAGQGDVLFGEVHNQESVSHLDAIYYNLRCCLPYTLCPYCHGAAKSKTCKFCKTRGFISEPQWKGPIPPELKSACEKDGRATA